MDIAVFGGINIYLYIIYKYYTIHHTILIYKHINK